MQPQAKKTKTKKSKTSKATKKKPGVVTDPALLSGPIEMDGDMYMSPYDLARYNLAEQRVIAARQARVLALKEQDAAMARFTLELRKRDRVQKETTRDLLALRDELSALYGVNFSHDGVSYDDGTGRIFVQDTEKDSA